MKMFERSVLRAQIFVEKVDSIERSGLLHLTPFVSVPRVCSAALPLRFKQSVSKRMPWPPDLRDDDTYLSSFFASCWP